MTPTTRINFSDLEGEILITEPEGEAAVEVSFSIGSFSIVVTMEPAHAVALGANLMNRGASIISTWESPETDDNG